MAMLTHYGTEGSWGSTSEFEETEGKRTVFPGYNLCETGPGYLLTR